MSVSHDVELRPVTARVFREALARHATGVVVVTAATPSGPVGFTVTSFTSVSQEPPLISFCLGRGSSSWPRFGRARHFAANLLAAGQEDVAARFARRGADRFGAPTRWIEGPAGLPLLHGSTTHLVCRRHAAIPVGDHILVVGLVVETALGPGDAPLLYHRGRFGQLAEG
ncbi:flavin reductase [Carbonactinospora thermoautotrophica]|uniref:Flavin reductase n=1 Tax=Carbonactinospora thermoautotrophica TaxID=1469144 RepID=A0A132MPA9_9ACTN|nr:flavin reductase family protein [Carbonactinospora thermoautotrophica]KWW99559.1 Flavin reductase domain protein FMN-binding protein [Carbonactinospora thermoautotrophica]KWX04230.1 flavin reductase [Carbonactinospora thermoautotrophica]KWX08695.1 flavin reductase [Carbonactinospora thermoautotrophica]